MNRSFIFAFALLVSCSLFAQDESPAPRPQRPVAPDATQKLERDVPTWMKRSNVPGMSAALVRGGKLVWVQYWGVQNAKTKEPVNSETIWEAASLSKVVTTYAALKLVDQGLLSLDTPLNHYLGNNYDIGDDPRIEMITARRVMTHSAGFPNWRAQGATKLPINFTPGERYSYSGEGFVYLATVMEKITGKKLVDLVRELVFEPLGMNHSSFEWLDAYATTGIYRHDWLGNVSFRFEEKGANAAASLHTTADDYARFIIAVMNGTGLKKGTSHEMLSPQIRPKEKDAPDIAWGLGVGLETTRSGKSFWHWGDQGDSKAYFTADLKHRDAIVYFTNSANGLSFASDVVADALGGTHPAVAYLGYPAYDVGFARMAQSMIARGAAPVLKEYKDNRSKPGAGRYSEDQMNTLGYWLMRSEKVDDAIEVFQLNTEDAPNSANAWDSLAEGYMTKGDKKLAIEYYEKSLALNPQNDNAVEQLKKLKM